MTVWPMFSGPPLPLPHDLPLSQLAQLAGDLPYLGAWIRGRRRELCLHLTGHPRGCRVLIDGDLGALLRSCPHVALREGSRPVVLAAESLIQWRTLQVVTATPYLPGFDALRSQFPEAQLDGHGLSFPIRSSSPEAVLAECLAQGIQVTGSRIIYDNTERLAKLGRAPPASSA